jgi:neutral ceramidase
MLAACLVLAAPAQAANLRAGVGKADITPRTGFYLGGWTRADRVAQGQHTRLGARALVLERDGRKLALVAVDLFMVPGGLVKHVGDALAARGFSERNLLISASHTHSGPGGFANYATLNTAAPSIDTIGDPSSFIRLFNPSPADRQLYTFLVQQIAAAIRRADRDRAPAVAGWGRERLLGLTRNRSLEAHLADHGIEREYGQGSVSQDPGGYEHTVDPAVNVLRVDKLVRRRGSRKRRRVPIGGWSTFAAHGTVTKSSFRFYNQDHHGSAIAVFEDGVRRAGRVPRRQQVLNVFGNTDEGDQSAGLDRHGPAASNYVGRVEAAAMLRAWRRARRGLSRRPALDLRWTRICFCGQAVPGGHVAESASAGLPFFTGSEEERGPLYDLTHQHFEGRRNPVSVGPQGHKLGVDGVPGDVPDGVPLLAVRVGGGLIVSIPGEATKEVGVRVRQAVQSAVAGSAVGRVVVSGLANEYVAYFTTPEEYDRQHYEGGQTWFGRLSSVLIGQQLAELAGRLVRGRPAQPALVTDPTNGVKPDGPPFGSGAAAGAATDQPQGLYRRLGHVRFAWRGGALGLDRPVERVFVTVQRRVRRRWRRVTTDLGLQMLWSVDKEGGYEATWEVPLTAPVGRYRIVVTAKRYRLVSGGFRVGRSMSLRLRQVPAATGRLAVVLDYPEARRDQDLTYRPRSARGGVVRFRVGSRTVRVRRKRGSVFSVRAPAGVPVSVPGSGARDRHRNVAGAGLQLQG